MNRHCHHCGRGWTLSGQSGRSERCHGCGQDLRVCLNCVHFALNVAHQCQERRAEPVDEKDAANFCEYFDFAMREFSSPANPDAREQAARDTLKKLFED